METPTGDIPTGDIQATFFATLVDEWVRSGIRDAVVSPGSRSTLMAAIIADDERLRTHVMVDERSASFFALGLAQATKRPTLIWTSTGTAVTELHSAIVEAHQAKVPLLVCTADRPPELHHSRDWQSIEQSHLYANVTRWSFDTGVATEDTRKRWRSIASRAVAETSHNPAGPGPVHLNLPIREPWQYDIGELPPGRQGGAGWHTHHRAIAMPSDEVAERIATPGRRGVVVLGKSNADPRAVHACAEALGWPVFAELRSNGRLDRPNTITTMDAMLRSERFAKEMRPEVVLRIGTPPLSRFVPEWLVSSGAEEWLVDPYDEWEGSVPDAANIVQCDPTELCRAVMQLAGARPQGWLERWREAEQIALRTIDDLVPKDSVTEPGIARKLVRELPDDTTLFAATSMPVRDLEWYGGVREDLTMFANRGVSGMDGLLSSAAGVSLGSRGLSSRRLGSRGPGTGKSTVMLVGDLSFLYDLNGLWVTKGAAEPIDLTIVVVDNNGGGIFSVLPYFSEIETATFERVLGTPQNVDIPAISEALGAKVEQVKTLSELVPAVRRSLDAGGIRVVYATTDREENAQLHRAIHVAVSEKLRDGSV